MNVERSVPTPGPGPGFTAMVVDDHPLVRESMVARLMAMGARDVVGPPSVAEARARANAGGVRDLCVLDVGLPDGSGLDLLADLPSNGWARVPPPPPPRHRRAAARRPLRCRRPLLRTCRVRGRCSGLPAEVRVAPRRRRRCPPGA